MLLSQSGEPGIMGPLARTLLARLYARTGEHAEAAAVLEPALAAAATSDEVRLVGPVTLAKIELAWLAGDKQDLHALAEPVFRAPATTGAEVNRAVVCRYLQRAGYKVPDVPGCPEPWRSGLAGDWQSAAARWQARGEPYEQALELLSGEDPAAIEAGSAILADLGATGATHLVPRLSQPR